MEDATDMTLHYVVALIIGLLIAWKIPTDRRVALIWDGLRQIGRRLAGLATPAAVAPSESEPEALSDPATAPPSVGPRLTALQGEFESRIESLVHSREFFDNAQFREAVEILADPNVPLDTVITYAIGQSWSLSCAALAALEKRSDRAEALPQITSNFDRLVPFAFHFAFVYFLSLEERPPVGAFLLHARDWWSNNTLISLLIAEYFQRSEQLADATEFGPDLATLAADKHEAINAVLDRVRHPWAQVFRDRLQEHQRSSVDEAFLTGFGRFWRNKRELDAAIAPDDWTDALTSTEATAREEPVRSLLVSGEHRVGKTTFLLLLAKRLQPDGWLVFEASGADLMAGQKWFGELEGRIQRTISELAVSKKLIWYVPDLLQVALSGTHQGQSASILDQVMPAVTAGRLIIWTETSPAGMSRLLRLSPGLRSAFEVVRLEPMHIDDTTTLAHQMGAKIAGDMTIDAASIEAAITSARQYLSTSCMPGAALDLVKQTAGRLAKSKTRHISPHDVIVTLSQQTGLPTSILDNTERLDLSAMRAHFSARVIGQDEAVNAVVERIALLKAGLNDLTKPIGVLLFAGSTGTGKTELAKTLADFLFGSTDRMIRLDMSEFQTPESTAKILGGGSDRGSETDSLVLRVRKQPFSVVLLDEFEKAHPNVWDLFLQVFDDGRLTDSMGQVADFRHCIVIMTTNLGATSHRTSGLGFARSEDTFTSDQILRAVGQTFRPEFQNRIDKIIVFRPLTRELMRGILKKELASLLERRGFKDREWAVEWEASALEFLLEKGFTPEMGARPLKRAIDQYVLAPLAATIVERRFPEGDQFVFVRSDGKSIQAEFVDPDMDVDTPPPPAAAPEARVAGALPSLASMILSADGTADEQQALAVGLQEIETTLASEAWETLQGDGLERMREADFWTQPQRHETLAQIALMDRVKAAAGTAASLRVRQAKGSERVGKSSRELIQRLALQIHVVKEGIADVVAAAPIEVALVVEPALSRPGLGDDDGTAWCARVLDMYRGWAKARHMQVTEMANPAQRRLPWLLVSGFGAHRVLAEEMGLHVFEHADGAATDRTTARVRVVPVPLGDLPPDRLKGQIKARLEALPANLAIVRRYREAPTPLVRQIAGTPWRSGKLETVLAGNFDLVALAQRTSAERSGG
jgi:ATP-dependent Clp protease ATP-binding subunit ClpC